MHGHHRHLANCHGTHRIFQSTHCLVVVIIVNVGLAMAGFTKPLMPPVHNTHLVHAHFEQIWSHDSKGGVKRCLGCPDECLIVNHDRVCVVDDTFCKTHTLSASSGHRVAHHRTSMLGHRVACAMGQDVLCKRAMTQGVGPTQLTRTHCLCCIWCRHCRCHGRALSGVSHRVERCSQHGLPHSQQQTGWL